LKVRFAPSPTGYLHIGNVRTALMNFLYTRVNDGQFVLRMDDTDPERSKQEFAEAIEEDLQWLGMSWDELAHQKERLARYEEAKQKLVDAGRLYPCYETAEEIEIKRKMLLSRGKPPIYDRAALELTEDEKAAYEAEGRQPHWRFKLDDSEVTWEDLVRGSQKFEPRHMSDPVLIREDGSPTYMMPSCVDDIDMGITHVLRGEDHVSNTAIQIQLIEALGGTAPIFSHFSLLKTKEGELSKRKGGSDVRSLRADGIEPMAILSLLVRLGTSQPVEVRMSVEEVIEGFSIDQFGRAPANYDVEELKRLNAKIVAQLSFAEVKPRLEALGMDGVNESFWNVVRANIQQLPEAKDWWAMCHQTITPEIEDSEFTQKAAELLPDGEWNEQTWNEWVGKVKDETGRKGKQLFMPLRLALTGQAHGPELKDMLPLIGREKAQKRLQGKAA